MHNEAVRYRVTWDQPTAGRSFVDFSETFWIFKKKKKNKKKNGVWTIRTSQGLFIFVSLWGSEKATFKSTSLSSEASFFSYLPTGTETETNPSRFSHNYQRGTASFVQTVKSMIPLFMCCDSVYCLITPQFKLTHVVTLGIITALTEDGN